jgi:hypothetical protein
MEEPKGLVEGTLEKFIDASKVACRALFKGSSFGAKRAPGVDFSLFKGCFKC